ncbi:hypothetical protein SK128_007174 [Halocaridina rubra]|uniref:Uncharacterized protein n=1 Tax=Halocaridina rubra TaxID=373956 RepID=A0AAN8WKP7_HALRR
MSTSNPLKIDHLYTGSAPDLGPETVDRIASVNQYLQQRWTNYFGELTAPLGGKAGWPSHVIGQSTLFVSKNNTTGLLGNNSVPANQGNITSTLLDGPTFIPCGSKDDTNINQKILDLRAWLDSAQSIATTPKEK